MKMKKILTEWRHFLEEGVSNLDIALKKIADINKSYGIKDREAQKQIGSIYLTYSLKGSSPRGSEEFYKGRINFTDLASMLKDLSAAAEDHQELGEQTTETKYFRIESIGQHTQYGNTEKIRVRSTIAGVAEAVFEDERDLQNRIDLLLEKIGDFDFDFSELSGEYEPIPRKSKFERGAGLGTGGIQKPDGLSPEEDRKFESMLAPLMEKHRKVLDYHRKNLGKDVDSTRPKEWYQLLLDSVSEGVIFFTYLADLWNEKTKKADYFSKTMTTDYEQTVIDLQKAVENYKEIIKNFPMDVEELIVLAQKGNKEAAKEAYYILAKMKDKRSRDMRILMRSM